MCVIKLGNLDRIRVWFSNSGAIEMFSNIRTLKKCNLFQVDMEDYYPCINENVLTWCYYLLEKSVTNDTGN